MSRLLAIAASISLLAGSVPATAQQAEAERPRPHHARQLLETGAFMLAGTVWYFSGQEVNAQDWDFRVEGGDLRTKFLTTNQIRFDNNTFAFNQVWHPLSYGGIYLVARSNNIGPWAAFAYAFFASLLWEYVGELREKVSINDQITSPLTAMAWGEIAYQYGEYFNHPESGSGVGRTVASVLGIPRLFHDWLDDVEPVDEPGKLYHPEPRLVVGGAGRSYRTASAPPQTLAVVSLDTTMAVMPGYGAVGSDEQFFGDGNFSDFSFEFAAAPDALEFDVDATVAIGGVYWQKIRPGRGEGNGLDFMLGGGRGYRLVSRSGGRLDDRLGLVHVLGPITRLRVFGPGRLRVEAGLDAFFDFAAVRSFAVPELVNRYGEAVLEAIRTDVKKHRYYFGVGFTVSPELAIILDRWRLELEGDVTRIHSIQGRDRFQEEVTRTIILNDLIWESRASVVAPLPPSWLDLRLETRLNHRWSSIDDVHDRRRWIEARAGVQATF